MFRFVGVTEPKTVSWPLQKLVASRLPQAWVSADEI